MSHVFLVCLDSPNAGRFYPSHLNDAVYFNSLSDFLALADSYCNKLAAPQSNVRLRTFGEGGDSLGDDDLDTANAVQLAATLFRSRGRLATFLVTVHHRQHATWQGTIHWMDGKKCEHFRSAFELTCIIYNALLMWIDWNHQTNAVGSI